MIPFGRALLDFYNKKKEAEIIVWRDDGLKSILPAGHFFREPDKFSEIEIAALGRCTGHVLDIGAGSGIHTQYLQTKGMRVTALDICLQAVDIMHSQGIDDVHHANIFNFKGGPFDTLLMLGHGIGMVENIGGLKKFLDHAHTLLRQNGPLIFDSLDVSRTDDPAHLAYHEKNRSMGRYIGATRLHFEYADNIGPDCGWLHVDFQTLNKHARHANWVTELIYETQDGEYLAQLREFPV